MGMAILFSLTVADVTTGPREIARASLPSMCDFVCQEKTSVELRVFIVHYSVLGERNLSALLYLFTFRVQLPEVTLVVRLIGS